MNVKLVQTMNSLLFAAYIMLATPAMALDKPDLLIENTVQTLLDEFTSQRDQLEADKRKLFALVDRIAVPLFDFERISKLVLAKNWKRASKQQRKDFGEEFKKLLIGTYATALFHYTGTESMSFVGSIITERRGRKFAEVNTEVTLSNGPPIPVEYSMILSDDGQWKIFNLTIEGLNMITNYRNAYGSAINTQGIDGLIQSMKQANAKNF